MGYDRCMPKRIVVAFIGTLLLASDGYGQTPAEKEKDAKEHYEQGIVQYNLTNYQEAIDHFKKAYELTKAPALLFNIAQAYRLKKDYHLARTFYQNYVREQTNVNPSDPNIKEAETFVAEMDRLMKEPGGGGTTTVTPPTTEPVKPPSNKNGASTPAPHATPPPAPTPIEPVEPDEPSRPGSSMKVTGIAVGAAGVVVLGVGSYYWWKTESFQDDVSEECEDQACLDMKEKKGKRYELLGWTLGSAGVAAIGTGILLYYLGASKESSTEVSFAPLAGGGAVVLGGTF
jgi:tetratricopeptide (TPR) repeat protein